jgi:hypothetical protein
MRKARKIKNKASRNHRIIKVEVRGKVTGNPRGMEESSCC